MLYKWLQLFMRSYNTLQGALQSIFNALKILLEWIIYKDFKWSVTDSFVVQNGLKNIN